MASSIADLSTDMFVSLDHELITDNRAKCRHLKKLTCKGTFATGVYLSETPPLPRSCLGWSNNFVGSESGQIQSVKLLQNMVSDRAQHPRTPSQPQYTVYCSLPQIP
jgi:hypothetical protein